MVDKPYTPTGITNYGEALSEERKHEIDVLKAQLAERDEMISFLKDEIEKLKKRLVTAKRTASNAGYDNSVTRTIDNMQNRDY